MELVLVGIIVVLLTLFWWQWKKPKHPIDALPGGLALPFIGTTWAFFGTREGKYTGYTKNFINISMNIENFYKLPWLLILN
jgi:hypothetical protein